MESYGPGSSDRSLSQDLEEISAGIEIEKGTSSKEKENRFMEDSNAYNTNLHHKRGKSNRTHNRQHYKQSLGQLPSSQQDEAKLDSHHKFPTSQ